MLLQWAAWTPAVVLALAVTAGLAFGQVKCPRAEPPGLASPSPPASFASVLESAKAAVVSMRLPSRLTSPAPAEALDEEGLEEGIEDGPLDDVIARLLAARSGAMVGAGVIVDAAGTR